MKHTRDADPDIAPEYDFSTGRRGVHLDRARRGIDRVRHPPPPSRDSSDTDAAAKPPAPSKRRP
jgi:hypothetical protein